ncbi:hypothetical protein H4R19_002973 [Coemansia spiralis]|nr:hypothetical protein H4R19_002973 [Coemansia spiralis]
MLVANDAMPPVPPPPPGSAQLGRGNDNGFVFRRPRVAAGAARAVRAVHAASRPAAAGPGPGDDAAPAGTPSRKRPPPAATPSRRGGSQLEFPDPKRRLTGSPVAAEATEAACGTVDIVQDISVPVRKAPQPTPLISRTRTRVAETPNGKPTDAKQKRRSASGRRTAGPLTAANEATPGAAGRTQPRSRRKSTMGRRRSTFSMRGKRASSIGGGFKALPHDSVDAADFYRHISPELPEPIRLRQLLAWCARRMSKEPRWPADLPEHVAKMLSDAVREAAEDVHSAFEKGEIATSWYHRPVDLQAHSSAEASEIQAHPENTANREAKEKLLARIALLRAEDEQWVGELKRAGAAHARALDRLPKAVQTAQAPEDAAIEPIAKALGSIDWSPVAPDAAQYVQDADGGAIDAELDAAEAQIEQATQDLEIQLDAFHFDMHRASETHKHAAKVCDRRLKDVGFVLAQRRAQAQVVAKGTGAGPRAAGAAGPEDPADATRDLLRTLAATMARPC